MDFLKVVNGSTMYMMVLPVIIYVFGLAGFFVYKTYKRALELNFTKEVLRKIIKSTLAFALVPSISIVIGLFALAPVLGIPWPWLRLSVIGSVAYELMAANIATSAMGIELAQLSSSGITAMGNIMLVMAICMTTPLIIMTAFGDKAIGVINKVSAKENEFTKIAMGCLMLNLLCVLVPDMLSKSVLNVLTLVTSLFITVFMGMIIKKFKITWLKDYVMAFALILGMGAAIIFTNLLG